jgi:hypothetical protein
MPSNDSHIHAWASVLNWIQHYVFCPLHHPPLLHKSGRCLIAKVVSEPWGPGDGSTILMTPTGKNRAWSQALRKTSFLTLYKDLEAPVRESWGETQLFRQVWTRLQVRWSFVLFWFLTVLGFELRASWSGGALPLEPLHDPPAPFSPLSYFSERVTCFFAWANIGSSYQHFQVAGIIGMSYHAQTSWFSWHNLSTCYPGACKAVVTWRWTTRA